MSKDSEEPSPDSSPSVRDRRTVEYEWSGETTPSIAVVEAVAAATGRDPREMPPIQGAVDTDALDALLTAGKDGSLRVSFEYLDATVTVHPDGTIDVTV
ncbi:hypothetical protein B4589_016180 (plasmid) [Halolamina sp. CBA1230]|uniref:HalOD1 output domain-containing protein n=1 Tax=Halolamina sp. CBA1230 TaxID=1853690 RepID=UPI0009A21E7F|nr:HalOD1 output domain-containing protein [Halolamina sp. CBA1230]QKY21949.1 hypothetical protein B4589_016180 [Halolamina sp. CBA1230]